MTEPNVEGLDLLGLQTLLSAGEQLDQELRREIPDATPRAHEESPFPNPFWDEVKVIAGDRIRLKYRTTWEPEPFGDILGGRAAPYRDILVRRYAWCITAPESVQFVAEHAGAHGMVEIGAGNGYWAWCLKHLGVDVIPYDKAPPAHGFNWYHSPQEEIITPQGRVRRHVQQATKEWVPVRPGRPWHASRWPHRTLFLCWPPITDMMAASSLRHYRGNRLIYIGERSGGCTAGANFFRRLEAEWDLVAEHRPVQWSGMHDWICVYRRAAEPRPWPKASKWDYEED